MTPGLDVTDGLKVEAWQGLLVHVLVCVSLCRPKPESEAWSLAVRDGVTM